MVAATAGTVMGRGAWADRAGSAASAMVAAGSTAPAMTAPHGRGRRMFEGGELRLVLLKMIADAPRHGYELIKAIEELTGGAYAPSPGLVYPSLTMLGEMGLIEEQASEGARKRFAATPEGIAHVAEKAAEIEAVMAGSRRSTMRATGWRGTACRSAGHWAICARRCATGSSRATCPTNGCTTWRR